eukprot:1185895-Prorocentrum_minimum.AAC.7
MYDAQESGRAGRDGLRSHCLLLFRAADLSRQSSMVYHEKAGYDNLYQMVRFATAVGMCRRAVLAQHFGERPADGGCDIPAPLKGGCLLYPGPSVRRFVYVSASEGD